MTRVVTATRRIATLGALLSALCFAPSCSTSRSDPATTHSEGVRFSVSVEPATSRVGDNQLFIELRDAMGSPLAEAQLEARVYMNAMGAMPAMGGPASVRELGGGEYRADFSLAMGGTWRVEIIVRSGSGPAARAEGSVTVGTAGVRLDNAGDSAMAPMEGMADMEPMASERHPAEFHFDPRRLQRIGVKTAAATLRRMDTTIRAVGRVVAEETTLQDISLKVRGWLREVRVDAVGDQVTRGQVLFSVYSPELYAAEEEYLQALRSQRAAKQTSHPDRSDSLARAARNRLRLWDIDDREIDAIAAADKALQHVPIRSPVSGYVVEKNLVEGSAVEAGERLYRIAPLSRIWIEAEIYEYELGLAREGQAATVTLPYLLDKSLEAKVAYVYPTVDPKTRTARLRLELSNPRLELRPGMYANVRVHTQHGERLVVPQSAVLYSGERNFVFRVLREGHFRPQPIEVGLRSGDHVEVLSGLEPGDEIVTSATFLIASESRLRAALDQW